MKQDARSVLKLEKLVFDKLLFERKGFSSENNFEFNMEISLTGFFSFGTDTSISDEDKKELISKNTLAILMPYLRSEVSILTAQPEVECIVLPPFNINNLMGEARE